MAQTLNTYTVICPDPNCLEEFEIERDPMELARGDGELVECPACLDEWEWEYDQETDTLDLTADDEVFGLSDEAEDMDLTCTDEDDED
jgi:hypothetical protein